jgi:prepilin-type N-terminal cleavage/methylation domain-containing protein
MKNLENGYTLVELLITIAITGIVFMVAGTAIYQLSTVTGYGNDRLTAVHEMQNTAHWFTHDGQKALIAAGGNSLVLDLPEDAKVIYNLSGTTLQRVSGINILTLAQGVTELRFNVQDRLVTMNITSAISGRLGESVQGTYKVHLRSIP